MTLLLPAPRALSPRAQIAQELLMAALWALALLGVGFTWWIQLG